MLEVKRLERGWVGHHILGGRCRFRCNTLLTCGNVNIVVSTVGLAYNAVLRAFDEVGAGRYFETMAFHACKNDARYHDADVERIVQFDSPWCIVEVNADDKANDMHERVVDEIIKRLERGEELSGGN